MKTTSTLLPIILIIVHTAIQCIHGQSPYTFTYQGRLQNLGTNVTGLYDLQFTVYNAQTGGGQAAFPISVSAVPVSNGLFTVSLNFGSVFDGTTRWLQIGVKSNGAAGTFTLLSPRQTITSVPEAMLAHNVRAGSLTSTQLADGAVTGQKIANAQVVRRLNSLTESVTIVPGEGLTLNTVGNTLQLGLSGVSPSSCLTYSNCYWNLLGNGNILPGVHFLGTVAGETAPLEFRVNNTHAMRYEPSSGTPNIVGGYAGNAVAAGLTGATIGGGGQSAEVNLIKSDFSTISGGRANTVEASSQDSTIAGGATNVVGSDYPSPHSTIGGGSHNTVHGGEYNTIGGGYQNSTLIGAFGDVAFSTIGGGANNHMSGGCYYGTIAGGRANDIGYWNRFATIGGGDANQISGEMALGSTISGGIANTVGRAGILCTIGGGTSNTTGFVCEGATIGGGGSNAIGGGQGGGDWAVIGGGQENLIESRGDYAAIGGGRGNRVAWEARYGTIGGGSYNTLGESAFGATVAGGAGNVIQGSISAIGGGAGNAIQAARGTIGGGEGNRLSSESGTIGGGELNLIESNAPNATISGGRANSIHQDAWDATISGGSSNTITGFNIPYGSTIGGGAFNAVLAGPYNTISGGFGNSTSRSSLGPESFCTIAGGSGNRISGIAATIGGGRDNRIQGDHGTGSTIGGGSDNVVGSGTEFGTVSGGEANTLGPFCQGSTISGGRGNQAFYSCGDATIGGGANNFIPFQGNYATIPGGRNNEATRSAFAAGTRAKAIHQGAFVWGDSMDADIASTNENSITIRASGGYRLFSDDAGTVGVRLAIGGGSWTAMSDRNMKENFEAVSPREVLAKVAALPVQRWNYRTQDRAVRHIGPMAQDFKAAFDVGESDTGISSVDADGVALAAIQGLNQKLEEKDAEIRELREVLTTVQQQLAELNRERASK